MTENEKKIESDDYDDYTQRGQINSMCRSQQMKLLSSLLESEEAMNDKMLLDSLCLNWGFVDMPTRSFLTALASKNYMPL